MNTPEVITVFFSATVPSLSQTKWNKLMFFSDAAAYARYNQSLTGYEYVKLHYGPVPQDYRQLVDAMTEYVDVQRRIEGIGDSFTYIVGPQSSDITDEAVDTLCEDSRLLEIVPKVVKVFGRWTASKLSSFSHKLRAWREAQFYERIDLGLLKDDPYLKRSYGNENFANVLLGSE